MDFYTRGVQQIVIPAEYAKQAVEGTTRFYKWECKVDGFFTDWSEVTVDAGLDRDKEYRCTDISCYVSKDGEPAIRMLRTEAQKLQRKLGDTVEWSWMSVGGSIGQKIFTATNFSAEGIYTYRTKATINLNGNVVTPEQAAAEWEAKKDTHQLWFKYKHYKWNDVIGYPRNIIKYFKDANSIFELRPKALKIVKWSDIPQFVKVRHKATKQTFTFLGVDTFGYLAVFRRDCDDYSYNPPALELAPTSDQPLMYWGGDECPVPEGCTFEVTCRSGNVQQQEVVSDWKHTGHIGDIIAYRIIGLSEGYVLGGAV